MKINPLYFQRRPRTKEEQEAAENNTGDDRTDPEDQTHPWED